LLAQKYSYYCCSSRRVSLAFKMPCEIQPGDTAWVLLSSVLVLGMMPALAFFEAGLLGHKNTTSIIAQVMGGLAMLTLLWVLVGYSMAFSGTGAVIGNLDAVFMSGVSYTDCDPTHPYIPAMAYAFFQMMFAAITPLLMTGAFAERLRWRAFVPFMLLWSLLVYYPVAHWIWGGGWLASMGAQDFAGGIVVHTTAGTGSCFTAWYIGPRISIRNGQEPDLPSNLPLAALGAALLWMGWFGFNAGSALSAGPLAVHTCLNTQVAASACAVVWSVMSTPWCRTEHLQQGPSVVAILNGAVAGLAGVTPASGFITLPSAMVLGLCLGLATFVGCSQWKRTGIDDALDVSVVHGLSGMIGSLYIGIAGSSAVNSAGADGLIYGGTHLIGVQALAVAATAVWTVLATGLILVALDKLLGGLRHEEGEETDGLDKKEHREEAYDLPTSPTASPTLNEEGLHRRMNMNDSRGPYGAINDAGEELSIVV